jgi:hypothetical protein
LNLSTLLLNNTFEIITSNFEIDAVFILDSFHCSSENELPEKFIALQLLQGSWMDGYVKNLAWVATCKFFLQNEIDF